MLQAPPLWFQIPTGSPATLTGPDALSMKVEYSSRGPFPGQAFHTHKASYAGTTDVTQRRACMSATIIVARSLVK